MCVCVCTCNPLVTLLCVCTDAYKHECHCESLWLISLINTNVNVRQNLPAYVWSFPTRFVVDLRERLRAVWRGLDGADPRTHAQKLATYHVWMALPLRPSNVRSPSHVLPTSRQGLPSGYLELELSRHVLRNIARFRLRAHTLRVETGCWQSHNRIYDKCDLHDVQDEKHVLFWRFED